MPDNDQSIEPEQEPDSEQPNMDQVLSGLVRYQINQIVRRDFRDIVVIAMMHSISISELQGEMTDPIRDFCDQILEEFFSNEENDYATIVGSRMREETRAIILEAIKHEYIRRENNPY